MNVKEIREKARVLGLKNVSKVRKENLIRAIQETEGNSPCFKNIYGCQEARCLWREDCQN
jgi:hypothetical protein